MSMIIFASQPGFIYLCKVFLRRRQAPDGAPEDLGEMAAAMLGDVLWQQESESPVQ